MQRIRLVKNIFQDCSVYVMNIVHMKKLHILIIAALSVFFISATISDHTKCKSTPNGPVIEWEPDVKLTWSNFKSKNNPSKGFAVAASTCGFGYDGIINGNEMKLNIYVRFYCNESWYHKDYLLQEVLDHEQLHFDICELYGRIFYKNILFLRKSGSLNERTLNKLLYKLRDEYDATQDKYDKDTNHSTNGERQVEWNRKIKLELEKHELYADYKEF